MLESLKYYTSGVNNVLKMLKIEFSRAFINKYLYLSILIGAIITVSHLIQYVIPLSKTLDEYLAFNKPMSYPGWLFASWMGGNQYNMQGYLYYLLLPITSTIPFADSFFLDRKNGFIKNVFIRTQKVNYYLSKYLATFMVGGVAVIIPLLINFGCSTLLLPSMLPQASSSFDFINAASMWSELYFSHPFIYVFSYILIDFVFGGLIATIAVVVGHFVEHRFIVLISPLLFYIFVFSIFNLFDAIALEPINFLQPSFGFSNFTIILIEATVLAITTSIVFIFKGIKDETY